MVTYPIIIELIDDQIKGHECEIRKLKELKESVQDMQSCILPFDTSIILGAIEKGLGE